MTTRFRALADDIDSHEDEARAIRQGLAHDGPALIRALLDRGGFAACSLRQVAREAGLSPTYLSYAVNGRVILSGGAFLRLVRVLETGKAVKR